MEPLDLSARAPRSPYEKLDGLVMLPRTIDKLRATLPGGVAGEFRMRGTSSRLLEWLGIEEDAMREAVAAAKTDDDVAAWLRERVDASQYPEYNRRLLERTTEHVDKDHFYQVYPWARGRGEIKLFDIMLEDDRRIFEGGPAGS